MPIVQTTSDFLNPLYRLQTCIDSRMNHTASVEGCGLIESVT